MTVLIRRQFLAACTGGALAAAIGPRQANAAPDAKGFVTRGVVLVPEDLTLADWPERAKRAGLTTIALHHQNSPQAVINGIRSAAGQRFLEQCARLGLQVEYELHAMRELLPRKLFARDPDMFRMNEEGERVADFNCCVHSAEALQIIVENALALAEQLRPTTGRYFYWGDDGKPWCYCPKCRDLSPAEQALTVENQLCKALRQRNATARVAHLAYHNTLRPPTKVAPAAGVFLEFAPIHRRYDIPYADQRDTKLADGLRALDANLKVFPRDTAQVLEYWLDVSRFSRWRRPGVKLPWRPDVFRADVQTYRALGIRHITSFAAWIDAAYHKRYGDLSFIQQYGAGLAGGSAP